MRCFASIVMALAPGTSIERRDVLGLEITASGGSDSSDRSVNLDRAFEEYLAASSELETIVARWVRIAVREPEAASGGSIVSILRPAEHIAPYEQAMRAGAHFSPIVQRPFLGDLVEVMAFDSPDSFQMASESAIDELGLSVEEAWALTDQNLVNRIGTIERYPVEGERGLASLTGDNGLTPSLLALPDVCVRERAGIFLVVDRNVVLFGQSDDAASRRLFERVAATLGPQSLSQTPLACVDGALTVYASPDR